MLMELLLSQVMSQVNGSLSVTGGFDSGENLALIIALG